MDSRSSTSGVALQVELADSVMREVLLLESYRKELADSVIQRGKYFESKPFFHRGRVDSLGDGGGHVS
jgi:hypothetical protein